MNFVIHIKTKLQQLKLMLGAVFDLICFLTLRSTYSKFQHVWHVIFFFFWQMKASYEEPIDHFRGLLIIGFMYGAIESFVMCRSIL